LQALVPQTYGVQLADEGVAQVPVPVQCEIGVKVEPVHEAVPQATVVAVCWQAPAPSQLPLFPQGGLTGHWVPGAGVPAVNGAHDPRPLTLQAWQVGQAALPQQTPLVQKPLMHWLFPEQVRPFGLSAQLPAWQVVGATQSASAAQVVLHAFAPQT
jgi:hypothetical protein